MSDLTVLLFCYFVSLTHSSHFLSLTFCLKELRIASSMPLHFTFNTANCKYYCISSLALFRLEYQLQNLSVRCPRASISGSFQPVVLELLRLFPAKSHIHNDITMLPNYSWRFLTSSLLRTLPKGKSLSQII